MKYTIDNATRQTDAHHVPAIDRRDTRERLARIDRMIDDYRRATERQLLRRAIKLWRRAEHCQRQAEFDRQPERVH